MVLNAIRSHEADGTGNAFRRYAEAPRGDAGALAARYEQARYSDHPISVQQADDLRKRAGASLK